MDVPAPKNVKCSVPPIPPPLPPVFTHHPSYLAPPPPQLPASSGIAKSIAALDRRFAPSGLPAAKSSPFDFQPRYFFFYGSLMDLEVLQSVLELPDLPVVESGRIRGFEIRMWGIYPALVPSKDKTKEIMGTFWKVINDFQVHKLCLYETDAYKTIPVSLITNAGDVIEDARTFIWAGEAGSSDLEDGTFDIERYQKYFKGSVIRARNVGIGLGLGIGLPIVLVACVVVWKAFRRSSKPTRVASQSTVGDVVTIGPPKDIEEGSSYDSSSIKSCFED